MREKHTEHIRQIFKGIEYVFDNAEKFIEKAIRN